MPNWRSGKRHIGIAVVLACFLAAVSDGSFAAEPSKLLIAHGAISNNVAPLWIAKEQGIFKKYGLDVDLVFIIAGRAMQAMLAGQVPVGLVGGTHVTNANTAGGDFTMILGLENRLDYIFVAKPTIKSAEDLKGKKVAIGTPAGSASLATYVALDHLGLVPRREMSSCYLSAVYPSGWVRCAPAASKRRVCRPSSAKWW
jgi:NitT/TauT family transport system substrate-binding protein